MSIYLVAPLLVVVAVLQASAISHVTVWGVFPDLPLVLVVSWGLLNGSRQGAVWGMVSGLALDLLSGAPMGAFTAALVAVGLLAGQASRTPLRGSLILPALGLLVATLLYALVFMLVQAVSGQAVLWLASAVRVVLPSAVLNALLAPGVYWVLRVLQTRFRREEMTV